LNTTSGLPAFQAISAASRKRAGSGDRLAAGILGEIRDEIRDVEIDRIARRQHVAEGHAARAGQRQAEAHAAGLAHQADLGLIGLTVLLLGDQHRRRSGEGGRRPRQHVHEADRVGPRDAHAGVARDLGEALLQASPLGVAGLRIVRGEHHGSAHAARDALLQHGLDRVARHRDHHAIRRLRQLGHRLPGLMSVDRLAARADAKDLALEAREIVRGARSHRLRALGNADDGDAARGEQGLEIAPAIDGAGCGFHRKFS